MNNKMKTINYRGGLVSFEIPSDWKEEYEAEGGGAFFLDKPDSGTLRLNVLSLASKEAEWPAQVILDAFGADGYEMLPCGFALWHRHEDNGGERNVIAPPSLGGAHYSHADSRSACVLHAYTLGGEGRNRTGKARTGHSRFLRSHGAVLDGSGNLARKTLVEVLEMKTEPNTPSDGTRWTAPVNGTVGAQKR